MVPDESGAVSRAAPEPRRRASHRHAHRFRHVRGSAPVHLQAPHRHRHPVVIRFRLGSASAADAVYSAMSDVRCGLQKFSKIVAAITTLAITMACIVMANVVMANVVMACRSLAPTRRRSLQPSSISHHRARYPSRTICSSTIRMCTHEVC